jgi:hypothetical protein
VNKGLEQAIATLHEKRKTKHLADLAAKQALVTQQEPIFDVPPPPPKQPQQSKHETHRLSYGAYPVVCKYCGETIWMSDMEGGKWWPLELDPTKPGYGFLHEIVCRPRRQK